MKECHAGILLVVTLMLVTGCAQPSQNTADGGTAEASPEAPFPSGDQAAAEDPSPADSEPADDRGFDPSGYWQGRHGPLVLMRAGDTLSFSYSAVFGATAHMCDGIGVAGFAGDGRWDYVDEEGTVTFTTRDDRVTMVTTDGIASFCGAYWPGDSFERAGWHAPFRCRVTEERAHFLVVGSLPPSRRPGYVVKGDQVEAWNLVNESSPAWLLARFVGPTRTTAGLLERDALECDD
jgi:hypothetical protein